VVERFLAKEEVASSNLVSRLKFNSFPARRVLMLPASARLFACGTSRDIREAIEMHLEGLREDGLPTPEPITKVENIEVTPEREAVWRPHDEIRYKDHRRNRQQRCHDGSSHRRGDSGSETVAGDKPDLAHDCFLFFGP
jgi:hypothetical protein